MRVANEDLITEAVDLSANAELRPIWLGHIAQYAIQLVFTGAPQGNFKLQASNDKGDVNAASRANQDVGIVNWTDVAGSPATVSAAGNIMWNAENVGYNWVRVVWTQTGGSGSLDSAKIYVKGV